MTPARQPVATRRLHYLVLLTLFGWMPIGAPAAAAEQPPVDFARDIQPLLAQNCLLCHGTDQAESGLNLSLRESAFGESESGAHAIVPGKARASELIARVSSDDPDARMPPEGDPLSAAQIELLKRWIDEGANWQGHWAYQPLRLTAPPAVERRDWVRGPIDQFVLAQLEAAGVAPSPPADRYTLIKRLYYDLVGLAPTIEEVDAFVADESNDAYEKLVDRLLDSKHFGERWGRHWLDAARYADSDGYEKDRPRPNAWRYRDWVIDAVNADMPFDQFTIEQLAGDLLPGATKEQRLATAFHRQTLTNTEGGTDQEEFRVEATLDRTETTGTVWLGLTVTCARCHSHKYDSLTQSEYYRLYAFFNQGNETNIDVPRSGAEMQDYLDKKKLHDEKLARLETELFAAQAKLQPQLASWEAETLARINAAEKTPVELHEVEILSAEAEQGGELKLLEDGSLLASGDSPATNTYTISLRSAAGEITGVRLDVLTDPSLPNKGPGRAGNGNFVLSKVAASVSASEDFAESTDLQFATATADFAQNKFPASRALEPKDRSGWAISPRMGKPHHVLFTLAEPVQGEYLRLVLDQQYGGEHTLGRLRLRVMTGTPAGHGLPDAVVAALRTEPEQRSDQQRRALLDQFSKTVPNLQKLNAERAALEKATPQAPTMQVRVLSQGKRATRLLHRGDFLDPREEVQPGVFGVAARDLPIAPRAGAIADRLDLARWLVDPENPLTPRVTVNRVWARLFGEGIVATINDFGVRGAVPTHPQLLDWLAHSFSHRMQWSRKQLIREIVTSAVYRQASRHREDIDGRDPINQLLSRQNRLRVEAEIVRDLALSASGLLTPKVGGPSVFPPLPSGVAEVSYANNFKWKTSTDEDRYRRGMYTFFKRTAPHPNLITFDCPDANTTNVDRPDSNTPLQALVMLNNEVFVEAAQHLAAELLVEQRASIDDRGLLSIGLRRAIARTPREAELDEFQRLLAAARAYYKEHHDDAEKLTARHAVDGVDVAENAAWVAVMRMVLNLDEVIVRD